MEKCIVCVHGRGQEWQAKYTVQREWREAIYSGIDQSQREPPALAEGNIVLAFYGDLFRPDILDGSKGITKQERTPQIEQDPIFQEELAKALFQEAVERGLTSEQIRIEEAVEKGPQAGRLKPFLKTLDLIPGFSRSALRFFVEDVIRYLHTPSLREKVMDCLIVPLRQQVQQGREIILIAHSLGSVVAYDVLSMHPELPVSHFITMGSPLGIKNCIYKRLLPDGKSQAFPATIKNDWHNFYDRNDIVALVPDLAPYFPSPAGKTIKTMRIYNRPDRSHSSEYYLNNRHVGSLLQTVL